MIRCNIHDVQKSCDDEKWRDCKLEERFAQKGIEIDWRGYCTCDETAEERMQRLSHHMEQSRNALGLMPRTRLCAV